MNLLSFISDPERKRELAARTKSSEGYLWQVATGWRGKRASPELAQLIEVQTGLMGPGRVPKESLRPDIWPPADQPSRRGEASPKQGDEASATGVPVQPVGEAA